MTIRARILIGFAVAFVACLGLGLFALQQTRLLNAVVTRFGSDWLPHVTVLGDLRAEINDHNRYLLRHVAADDAPLLEALEGSIANETELIDRWFEGAGASFTSDQQRRLLAGAKTSWAEYRDLVPGVLELSRDGVKHVVQEKMEGPVNTAFHKLVDGCFRR